MKIKFLSVLTLAILNNQITCQSPACSNANCSTCSNSPSQCSACKNGFYSSFGSSFSASLSCDRKCAEHCEVCLNSSTCLKCNSDADLTFSFGCEKKGISPTTIFLIILGGVAFCIAVGILLCHFCKKNTPPGTIA